MSRKFIAAIAATAGLAFAAQASATVFTLDSITVASHGVGDGNGLEVGIISHIPLDGLTFDLGDDDPQTFDLFTIYSDEGTVNAGEDTVAKPISVAFDFSAPFPNDVGPVGGATNGVRQLFGLIQYGKLTWNDGGQTEFTWGMPGNQGLMLITLSQGNFGAGPIHGQLFGYTVRATFDWDRDPVVTAVPEPATWALMIGGFGLAGGALRRRRTVAAAA